MMKATTASRPRPVAGWICGREGAAVATVPLRVPTTSGTGTKPRAGEIACAHSDVDLTILLHCGDWT